MVRVMDSNWSSLVDTTTAAVCSRNGEDESRDERMIPFIEGLLCHFCCQASNALKSCSHCKTAFYCIKDCQAKDWAQGHKQTCGCCPTNKSDTIATDGKVSWQLHHAPTAKLGFGRTVGLTRLGLPEILVVDIETNSSAVKQTVKTCTGVLAAALVAQKQEHPVLKRPDRVVRMTVPGNPDKTQQDSYLSYFAVLVVTDPDQLRVLQERYGVSSSTDSNNRDRRLLLLLMPVCTGTTPGWGQMPAAPEGQVVTRNHIKEQFEKQTLGIFGFVRMMDGNPQNCKSDNLIIVSLEDALAHPEWYIHWDMRLDEEQYEYLKRHQDHFALLSMGGIEESRVTAYIEKVCAARDLVEKYQRGIKIASM